MICLRFHHRGWLNLHSPLERLKSQMDRSGAQVPFSRTLYNIYTATESALPGWQQVLMKLSTTADGARSAFYFSEVWLPAPKIARKAIFIWSVEGAVVLGSSEPPNRGHGAVQGLPGGRGARV